MPSAHVHSCTAWKTEGAVADDQHLAVCGCKWGSEAFALRAAFPVTLRTSDGFRDSGHPGREGPEELFPHPLSQRGGN